LAQDVFLLRASGKQLASAMKRLPRKVELSDAQYEQLANKIIDKARAEEGLHYPDWVMLLGTCNAIFIPWCLGVYPEFIWLIFFFECWLFFLLRFREVVEPKPMAVPGATPQRLIRVLYMLEFCYYANFAGLVVVMFLVFNPPWFTREVARRFFAAAFGVSGGMLLATAAFGNQLLLHNVDSLVSVFLHVFPFLVCYTLRWHYDRLHYVWPMLFNRGPYEDIELLDILVYGGVFYATWAIPYTIWMLLGASQLPQNMEFDTCLALNRKKNVAHDTLLHFTMRGAFGKVVCRARGYTDAEWQSKCKEHDFAAGDVPAIMVLHGGGALTGCVFSLPLYLSPHASGCSIAAILVLALYAGSKRYRNVIYMSGEVLKALGEESDGTSSESEPEGPHEIQGDESEPEGPLEQLLAAAEIQGVDSRLAP